MISDPLSCVLVTVTEECCGIVHVRLFSNPLKDLLALKTGYDVNMKEYDSLFSHVIGLVWDIVKGLLRVSTI